MEPYHLARYLKSPAIIDWLHPFVQEKARERAEGFTTDGDIARSCFLLIRGRTINSRDYPMNPVTFLASDVLRYRTVSALQRTTSIPRSCGRTAFRPASVASGLHPVNMEPGFSSTGSMQCIPKSPGGTGPMHGVS